MALNDLQKKKFGDGASGTSGLIDDASDLTSAWVSRVRLYEKGLKLFPPSTMNLQMTSVGASSSGEDDEPLRPISKSGKEFLNDSDGTHQPIGDLENMDHIITIPEPDNICRTCGPGEEITETDNLLVKLGCRCRGSLSKMHRKCILEWYGPRICKKNDYKCELCNAVLHGRVERIVFRAWIGRDSGRDILVKAMEPFRPPPSPHANLRAPALQGPIDIVEITHPTQRPQHHINSTVHYMIPEPEPRACDGCCPLYMKVCVILALVGFAILLGSQYHHR